MAAMQRRPEAVIHHSDQGAQHASLASGNRCRELVSVKERGETTEGRRQEAELTALFEGEGAAEVPSGGLGDGK